MYDMSFECYYDYNKQQFIHKIELILIAVAVAAAVGPSFGLFLLFVFLLLYGEQIIRCCIVSSERMNWPSTKHVYLDNSSNVIRSARGQRFEWRLSVSCSFRRIAASFWIKYFMLITSRKLNAVHIYFDGGNFG